MKKFTIEFNWAIIYTLASLLWTVLEKSLGFHNERIGSQMIFSWAFGLVAIPVYFLALNDKKKNFFNGKGDWKQLFLSGVVMSVFVAILSVLAQYISYTVISPDYVNNYVDFLTRTKKMTAEQAQLFFSFNSLVLQGASSGISLGVIISAIVALFIKTETAVAEPVVVQKPKTKSKSKRK